MDTHLLTRRVTRVFAQSATIQRRLQRFGGIRAEALINATSVGMAPEIEQLPAQGLDLSAFRVVMDIVYSPLETRLLREAAPWKSNISRPLITRHPAWAASRINLVSRGV